MFICSSLGLSAVNKATHTERTYLNLYLEIAQKFVHTSRFCLKSAKVTEILDIDLQNLMTIHSNSSLWYRLCALGGTSWSRRKFDDLNIIIDHDQYIATSEISIVVDLHSFAKVRRNIILCCAKRIKMHFKCSHFGVFLENNQRV